MATEQMASDMASMATTQQRTRGDKVVWAILAVLALYFVSLLLGLPQHATELVVAGHGHAVAAEPGVASAGAHGPATAHAPTTAHHATPSAPPY